MRDDLDFKVQLANLRRTLQTLRDQGLVTAIDFTDFFLSIWGARTREDLQDITSELCKVCEGQPFSARQLRKRITNNTRRGEINLQGLVIAGLLALACVIMMQDSFGCFAALFR
jgi:hypothetical protein